MKADDQRQYKFEIEEHFVTLFALNYVVVVIHDTVAEDIRQRHRIKLKASLPLKKSSALCCKFDVPKLRRL